MVIQIPTSVTTRCHRNEHLLLSTVDRTCQLNHINHILIRVVLFITEIHLAKLATLVLVLISQVLMAKYLNNPGHMVNQLSQWVAPYQVSHSHNKSSYPMIWWERSLAKEVRRSTRSDT